MQRQIFCAIAVLVGCNVLAFFAHATPVAAAEPPSAEEQKVLLDCRHSDYRTYIKCLKRQKRHHFGHGDSHADIDGVCMEACMKKCDMEDDCDKKCSYCTRRTKHRHQIITEYETECVSEECKKKPDASAAVTNITTKIDINNFLNTSSHQNNCCPTCHPPIPCYPLLPPLTLVPQLTLGLGLGIGCLFPGQWNCGNQPVPPIGGGGIDCSGCGNLFMRNRCDTACYAVSNSNQYGNTNGVVRNHQTPCTSPYCVGGAK